MGLKVPNQIRLRGRATLGRSINQLDSVLVAAALKWSVQPDAHNFERGFEANHSFAKGEDIRIVVLTTEPGGFKIPTQSAADYFDSIGNNGFAVARAA